ncbi:MAG: aminodeoxychorismate synthase component I [Caldithrix sp.]|nr:aminodeoxychorismate synthase component I [Caldithrix sp.]
MNNLIRQYLESVSLYTADYHDVSKIRTQWTEPDPAMYIPRWQFGKISNIELIIRKFYGIIEFKHNVVTIRYSGGVDTAYTDNPFTYLRSFDRFWQQYNLNRYLFYTGLLAYDLHRYTENVSPATDFYGIPDFYLLIPGDFALIEHDRRRITIGKCLNVLESMDPHHSDWAVKTASDIKISEPKPSYINKINTIRSQIIDGEVYQINYTIRFSTPYSNSAYSLFKKMYTINPAPFSVYVQTPSVEVVCNSPERFLSVSGNDIITEPIKGTIKKLQDSRQDADQIETLLSSEKDAAELSMIVDLLRNDLSKVSAPGSVRVENHRRLESFTNVHHLVSTVRSEMDERYHLFDLIRGAFPGGSISGCPKIAALKLIASLESHNRGFYTGSFFLRFPGRHEFDSNILIRTAQMITDILYFQAGGGIVIDSEPESEYEECLAKANSFLKAVGS